MTAAVDAALDALERAARALRDLPVDALDASEAARAHDRVRAVVDRVQAFAARLLAHVEADGRWAASGAARTFPDWVSRRSGSSVGAARRAVAVGRALRDELPTTQAALDDGRITYEHAQLLATLGPTSEARRAALAGDRADRNEGYLVREAERRSADEFRRLLRRWGAAVDAAALEREHAAAVAAEHLTLAPRTGGVQLSGFLAAENAEVLRTALRAVTGVPAADDERTPEQRAAAALGSLARLVLDRGLAGAGGALVRPHLSVHVDYEVLERLAERAGVAGDLPVAGPDGRLVPPAELDDGTPLPASVLARIACDSAITRIVFGPDGAPLDVGRAQRTYTGPQRRAVVARDRHCQYPGCAVAPVLCEVHHTVWWCRGGHTSVETGVLLCWHHHDVVHRRDIRIVRTGGAWRFTERDGREIRAGRAGGGAGAAGGAGGAPSAGGDLSAGERRVGAPAGAVNRVPAGGARPPERRSGAPPGVQEPLPLAG